MLDYEVASVIARVRTAIRHVGTEEAERVTRMLRTYVDESATDP